MCHITFSLLYPHHTKKKKRKKRPKSEMVAASAYTQYTTKTNFALEDKKHNECLTMLQEAYPLALH